MTFAHWFSTWSWGTVPDWFVGVGTVGTLGFTVYLLYRDRQREVRSNADHLVTWTFVNNDMFEVHAYNSGHAPIPYGWVSIVWEKSYGANVEMSDGSAQANGLAPILPQSEDVWTIPMRGRVGDQSYVSFIDASGRKWHRDLTSNRYVKSSKLEHAVAKARKEYVRRDEDK